MRPLAIAIGLIGVTMMPSVGNAQFIDDPFSDYLQRSVTLSIGSRQRQGRQRRDPYHQSLAALCGQSPYPHHWASGSGLGRANVPRPQPVHARRSGRERAKRRDHRARRRLGRHVSDGCAGHPHAAYIGRQLSRAGRTLYA